MFDIKKEVLEAAKRIQGYVKETSLDYSMPLSDMTGAQVFLKCENLQYTGSFKVRGAFNKLLSLTDAERKQGVIAASSGNHGAAIAFGLNQLKIPGIVFVPENTSSTKVENIRRYHIPLEFYATDCVDTEVYAREYAKQHQLVYASPYNDVEIIAGQGTIALELIRQLNQIDAVLVPIGGGGIISGIAGYLKAVSPKTQVIGCLPENSPVMAASIQAGKIIDMPTLPTLSDATAGGIEPNAITFEICQKFVDDTILVSESEIRDAMITLLETHHMLIEGAVGVVIASLFKNAKQFQGKNVVAVLTGANISLEALKSVLNTSC